jgi:L-seryl-tRNA(Ser) seleniumtransferase
MIGGGSLPGGTLPTKLVAIGKQSKAKEQSLAQKLALRLRAQEPPVVGRISENVLLLDPRSVLPEEDKAMRQALRSAVADLRAKGKI